MPSRAHKPGIYAPIPTFFLPQSEDLDIPSFKSHITLLANAGVTPLIAGSMGEGPHLSHSERKILIKAARSALDEASFNNIPVVAGTGASSTRETVELCREAAEAGADSVIVIASGYFAGALAGNKTALKSYWTEVAERSPVPVFIYNYPGASGGIDLDSDLITELAVSCPNIIGVKLTCGNVGKLTRICATVSLPTFASAYPRKESEAGGPFLVLGGFADFILPSTFVDGHGAIIGLANIAPHACVKLFNMSMRIHPSSSSSAYDSGTLLTKAQHIQGVIARGDFTIAKGSIAGTKMILEREYGYGGSPRKPLLGMENIDAEALWNHQHVKELLELEKACSKEA